MVAPKIEMVLRYSLREREYLIYKRLEDKDWEYVGSAKEEGYAQKFAQAVVDHHNAIYSILRGN